VNKEGPPKEDYAGRRRACYAIAGENGSPMVLLVLGASPHLWLCTGDKRASRRSLRAPNIIFNLADDIRYDDLELMPKTQYLIVKEGLEYENAFATTPLCCPSRTSILRGTWYRKRDQVKACPLVQTGCLFLSRSSP
jgi:hypothetical protein